MITHDLAFEPRYGEVVQVSPLIRRLTAPNPGPLTFLGTNTYIVGQGDVAIIDPGPDDEAHIGALVAALADETICAVLMTHGHPDHVGGAPRLEVLTGHRTRRLEEGDQLVAGGGRYAQSRRPATRPIMSVMTSWGSKAS